MERPIKMDDLGVPIFLETPIYSITYLHPLAPPHHIQNPRDIHSSILKDDIATLPQIHHDKNQLMGSPPQHLLVETSGPWSWEKSYMKKTTLDDQFKTNNQNNKLHPSKRTWQFKKTTFEDVSLNENRDFPFAGGQPGERHLKNNDRDRRHIFWSPELWPGTTFCSKPAKKENKRNPQQQHQQHHHHHQQQQQQHNLTREQSQRRPH